MSDGPKKTGSPLAYIFSAIVFFYGLIAVVRRRMWLHDPSSKGETVVGTQAVLFGIATMIFGYLIYVALRYVEHGMAKEYDPVTPTNKILLGACILLATIAGLWQVILIFLQ